MNDLKENIIKKMKASLNEGKDEIQKIKEPRDLIKQIPNLFTISRLLFVPFIVANIMSGNLITAGFIAIGASITDMLDGKVARALNATSNFGAKLDAVIDKLFVTCITAPLLFINPYLLITIILELSIASITGYAHLQDIKTATNKTGKIKTVFLDSLLCASFFSQFGIIEKIAKTLFLATTALQLKTARDYYDTYIIQNRNVSNNNLNNVINNNHLEEEKKQDKTINKNNEKEISKELDDLIKFRQTIMQYQNSKEMEHEKSKIKK